MVWNWRPPIWKSLPGLRRYAISDRGEVRSSRGIMKTHPNDEGYPVLKLTHDDGTRRHHAVHRLVAQAHLPPPGPGQTMVLHKDDCRGNASASNLYWGDHAANHADKVARARLAPVIRKLTKGDVKRIRRANIGAARLAKKLGLSISHVREIRNRRKWK